jgi:hypothetical protein
MSVYGTAADLTGKRTTPTVNADFPGDILGVAIGGLKGYGSNWDSDFGVEWVITDTGGSFNYVYTFLGFGFGDKDISHFVLELSPDCISSPDPDCVTNIKHNGGNPGDVEYGNFDGIATSVKFDYGGGDPQVYSFTSNRAPVWGHLAVKDGGGSDTCDAPPADTPTNLICSNQLVGIGLNSDTLNFVARPNGLSQVPVPASVWLFGSALGLLGWTRRKLT